MPSLFLLEFETRKFISFCTIFLFFLVDENSVIKIADVGLARLTTFENKESLQNFHGHASLAYLAPELWSATGVGFTTKSDIYSMGIVFCKKYCGSTRLFDHRCLNQSFRSHTSCCCCCCCCCCFHLLLPTKGEMINRCQQEKYSVPFPGTMAVAIMPQVKAGRRPVVDPEMPTSLVEIIKEMWDNDPSKRPNCQEIKLKLEELERSWLPTINPLMNSTQLRQSTQL